MMGALLIHNMFGHAWYATHCRTIEFININSIHVEIGWLDGGEIERQRIYMIILRYVIRIVHRSYYTAYFTAGVA